MHTYIVWNPDQKHIYYAGQNKELAHKVLLEEQNSCLCIWYDDIRIKD